MTADECIDTAHAFLAMFDGQTGPDDELLLERMLDRIAAAVTDVDAVFGAASRDLLEFSVRMIVSQTCRGRGRGTPRWRAKDLRTSARSEFGQAWRRIGAVVTVGNSGLRVYAASTPSTGSHAAQANARFVSSRCCPGALLPASS